MTPTALLGAVNILFSRETFFARVAEVEAENGEDGA
jgi:hypothetical protein